MDNNNEECDGKCEKCCDYGICSIQGDSKGSYHNINEMDILENILFTKE